MHNPWDDISPPSDDVSARRIDHNHNLNLFWARDHLGRYLFIFELPRDAVMLQTNLPELAGIQLTYMPAVGKAPARLVLVLNEKGNWEIFLALCNDLVHATRECRSTQEAVQSLLRRLGRWQDILKKQRTGLLSEEQIKGLIGELLFLRDSLIPIFGAAQAVKFWQGPETLPQDFNVNDCAIEVKCQSGNSQPKIRISSAEQLCPQLPEMYLAVVTLGRTPPETSESINLPLLVDQIRQKLDSSSPASLERFNDLLYMVGYLDSDRYCAFSYLLANREMYHVSEGFPRVVPDDLPHGVTHLTYSIDLSECEPFKGAPDWMEELK